MCPVPPNPPFKKRRSPKAAFEKAAAKPYKRILGSSLLPMVAFSQKVAFGLRLFLKGGFLKGG